MIDDLISREALKEAINSNIASATNVGIVADADYLWELLNYAIDNAPTVECTWIISGKRYGKKEEALKYLRPHGKWILNDTLFGSKSFRCSVCNDIIDDVPTCLNKPLFRFCPNCGADMREADK